MKSGHRSIFEFNLVNPHDLMVLFTNKNKKVISAVMDYYDGKINSLPCTVEDIRGAMDFVKSNNKSYSPELLEQLKMLETMLRIP